MGSPTVFEQLIHELVNRARLDPAAEAARLGISLNDGLAAGTISNTAKDPLAFNSQLIEAARGHSQHMLNVDKFGHAGIGDGDPGSRATAAGYNFNALAENIAVIGTSGTAVEATMAVANYVNLFVDQGIAGRGHRLAILGENYRELGNGEFVGQFDFGGGQIFNSTMLTQEFGFRAGKLFVTGVAFNDANASNFYDIGEARSGIAVQVKSGAAIVGSTTTETAGGYNVGFSGGSVEVIFSSGGLAAPVSVSVAPGAHNAKVDLLGANKVLSSASVTLGANAVSLGLLGIAAISGTGNALANTLDGSLSNGANTLTGLGGNDTYIVGSGDLVVEAGDAAGGVDTVSSAFINLNLANFANVENITLLGSAALSATGNDGANALNGASNSAANVLTGLDGNDVYTIGAGDRIVEAATIAGGVDTVQSSAFSLDLANFANIENIALLGVGHLSATGNSANNVINGASNTSANVLIGLAGNDAYVVDAGDTIVEDAGASGGVDIVRSALINIDLARFPNVENITLLGALALTAKGNVGANVLNGSGNTAANALTGLAGNDTYVVGAGDTIVEVAGAAGGVDVVMSNLVSLSLSNFANVENVTLYGALTLNATGDSASNVITGNAGVNVLTGGAGADFFVFNAVLNSTTNVDRIADFNVVDDAIRLENSGVFSALTVTGTLSAAAFFSAAGAVTAHDSDDRIIYNSSTGDIYYDADGINGVAAIQFANLSSTVKPAVTNADFVII